MKLFPLSGAGSLPFLAWDDALRFVAEYCPDLPYLPELPNADARDFLVMRPLQGVASARYLGNGQGELVAASVSELAESIAIAGLSDSLREQIASFKRYFSAAPIRKFQCVGPVTLCENIFWSGARISANETAHKVMLEFYGKWFGEFLAAIRGESSGDLCFLDEPMLGVTPASPTARERGEGVLRQCLEACVRSEGIPAIHCCAPISHAPAVLWEARGLSFDASLESLQKVVAKLRLRSSNFRWLGLGLLQPGATLTSQQCDRIATEVFCHLGRCSATECFLTAACGLALTTNESCVQTYQSLRLLQEKLTGV